MAGLGYGAHTERAVHVDDRTHGGGQAGALFEAILGWAGVERHVTCSDPHVIARLHADQGGTYLWVANPTRRERFVRLGLGPSAGSCSRARTLWGTEATCNGRDVTVSVGGRDVAVVELN